jgi:hypothetical protein
MHKRLKESFCTRAEVVFPRVRGCSVFVYELLGRIGPQLQLVVGHQQVLVEQETENLLQILVCEQFILDLDCLLQAHLYQRVVNFDQSLLILVAHDDCLEKVHQVYAQLGKRDHFALRSETYLHDYVQAITQRRVHKVVRIGLLIVAHDLHAQHNHVLVFLFEIIDKHLLLRVDDLVVLGEQALKAFPQTHHELVHWCRFDVVFEAVQDEFVQYFQANDRLVQVERVLFQAQFGRAVNVVQTLLHIEELELDDHLDYFTCQILEHLAIIAQTFRCQ